MVEIDQAKMREELIQDEGLELRPYTDTVGALTIGVGRNLSSNGISEAEAMVLLDNDITETITGLDRAFPWWRELSPGRQRALVNMAFNLGLPRLYEFRRMLAALREAAWREAAAEALDSRWADQVGFRAKRIAETFLNDPETI